MTKRQNRTVAVFGEYGHAGSSLLVSFTGAA